MAASELIQTQHELASRVSNQFIAGRLASAKQHDQDSRANQLQQHARVVASSSSSASFGNNHQKQQRGESSPRDLGSYCPAATNNNLAMPVKNQANSEKQPDQSWPLSQLPLAKHEDSDSSTASEHDDDQDQRAGHSPPTDQTSRTSHVGPMGIFFKVWSLVKVTKNRHNRMKRQISEAATASQQFQFVPGEQFGGAFGSSHQSPLDAGHQSHLATPRGSHQQAGPIQRHLLQDSHFKRAGSQPPPSSHIERRGFQFGPVGQSHQLNPVATNGLQTATNSTIGTTGSSSGVSSTTSSMLATNYLAASDATGLVQPRTSSDSSQFSNGRQEDAAPSQVSAQRTAVGNGSSGRSWTARIKRTSPTTQPLATPPTSSNTSRYRVQRAPPDKRQSMQLTSSGGVAGSRSQTDTKRQLRAQSEVKQLEELRRKAIAIAKSSSPTSLIGGGTTKSKMSLERFRQRLMQDSVSDHGVEDDEDEDNDEDDDDEGDKASRAGTRQRQIEDDEDSDLNDIYSTPNDSIQSVPSGQIMLDQRRTSAGGMATPVAYQPKKRQSYVSKSPELERPRETNLSSYHMTKSFSAHQFDQLADNGTSNNNRTKRQTGETKLANSTILENDQDAKRQQASRTKSNGSRFFISSSSSEDSSNSPAQTRHTTDPLGSSQTCYNGHQQQSHQNRPTNMGHQQIPVQSGLHYHGPAPSIVPATRPSSLTVPSTSPVLLLQSGEHNILTPNTFIVNGAGLEPSLANVAAMSPMFCSPTPATNLQENSDIHRSNRTAINSNNKLPSCQLVSTVMSSAAATNYKKSPSLFDMTPNNAISSPSNLVQRFSSKYPWAQRNNRQLPMSSFIGANDLNAPKDIRTKETKSPSDRTSSSKFSVPNSVSLHDCKLTSVKLGSPPVTNNNSDPVQECQAADLKSDKSACSEYKLAQMLLELGSNPSAKDETGCTALMHAIMSENLSAFKCLVEHGVDLNDTNNHGLSALDLICSKPANEILLEMLKLMIDNQVDLDRARKSDGSRLLDRLIGEHQKPNKDKTVFIDCLLHNGAKLGSSTWSAARGKHEIQLKLLRKLCQDGYFLYKKLSIEAAVFRFEYALKRIDELEQQLLSRCRQSCLAKCHGPVLDLDQQQAIIKETQLVKYQTFLGLSRCERKRGFFKRALEFADMSILIDSTSYEGYYSKAHILKDIGERDDAILTIDQTGRLVSKAIETIKEELNELDIQEESLVFDGCFNMHDPNKSSWIEATRLELKNNLDYLTEAQRHILKLKGEIVKD